MDEKVQSCFRYSKRPEARRVVAGLWVTQEKEVVRKTGFLLI